MIDRFGRPINYLRISVTDRCNLRCRYCMPEEGIPLLSHADILRFEEIIEVVRVAVTMGISKIRLTGGEPLVRQGIVDLVQDLATIEGVRDLAMTTNGILLTRYARGLADAGLRRINISLDTTDPFRFQQITRGGDVHLVLAGIQTAKEAGLEPIKLNCVVGPLSCESDEQSVKTFGRTHGLEVRTIQQMCFESGCFSVVQGGSGGDCQRCNRLRLSSDGFIHPCLFSDMAFSVRSLGAYEAIHRAIKNKPESGRPCSHHWMYGIGG